MCDGRNHETPTEGLRRAHPRRYDRAPQARGLGEDPQRPLAQLSLGLVCTAATAFSLFSTLVLAGTWLCEGTPPRYLPSRRAWLVSLLLAATGSAFVAWRADRLRRAQLRTLRVVHLRVLLRRLGYALQKIVVV